MRAHIAFGAALLVAGIFASQTASAWQYTVTDLDMPGSTYSFAYGVNNSGQVTGNTRPGFPPPQAFLYSNGSMTQLGTLGGATSFGHGISDAGQVVGYTETLMGTRAFLYSNGAMTSLGTLGGTASVGFGVNNLGQATGYSLTSGDASSYAFLYSNGTMTNLGALGGTGSIGYGINDAGQVTGLAYIGGNVAYHAFVSNNGSMADLGTLDGHNYSEGQAINGSGQVAGTSCVTSGGNCRAFLYDNGTMLNLGALGGLASFGNGLNSAGQVVGSILVGTDYRDRAIHNAFLYSGGEMVDLNTLIDPSAGWTLSVATDINDSGQIVGWGTSPDGGVYHAFLLTPVPEPEIYAMMLVGLGLVGVAVRRRRG